MCLPRFSDICSTRFSGICLAKSETISSWNERNEDIKESAIDFRGDTAGAASDISSFSTLGAILGSGYGTVSVDSGVGGVDVVSVFASASLCRPISSGKVRRVSIHAGDIGEDSGVGGATKISGEGLLSSVAGIAVVSFFVSDDASFVLAFASLGLFVVSAEPLTTGCSALLDDLVANSGEPSGRKFAISSGMCLLKSSDSCSARISACFAISEVCLAISEAISSWSFWNHEEVDEDFGVRSFPTGASAIVLGVSTVAAIVVVVIVVMVGSGASILVFESVRCGFGEENGDSSESSGSCSGACFGVTMSSWSTRREDIHELAAGLDSFVDSVSASGSRNFFSPLVFFVVGGSVVVVVCRTVAISIGASFGIF